MEYFVAKSYSDWVRESDPFEDNKKMYVKVRNPKGGVKTVRAYNEKEYKKLYGEPAVSPVLSISEPMVVVNTGAPRVKEILGFQNGYIWIFKGDLDMAEYWFSKMPECRYHVIFGWYIVSQEEIPSNIPSCIQPVKLEWEKVGNADGTLLPKATIEQALEELIYGAHPSTHQGIIGERLERSVTLIDIVDMGETQYGSNRMYIFEDNDSNVYTWKTGVTKDWEITHNVNLRGTVKEHEVYKGVKRTSLTRVMEVKV